MRLLRSFRYAWNGLTAAIRTQPNLRIHLGIITLVVFLGFYFSISTVEWCIILLSMGMVLGTELLNSAIEEWVNHISPERNEKAGRIKDIAAAAVLCVSLIAGIIGLLIFGKYFFS